MSVDQWAFVGGDGVSHRRIGGRGETSRLWAVVHRIMMSSPRLVVCAGSLRLHLHASGTSGIPASRNAPSPSPGYDPPPEPGGSLRHGGGVKCDGRYGFGGRQQEMAGDIRMLMIP
ncbi:hypothetical protein GCM10018952_47180 [Streptosporangium vulgare]